MSVADCRGARRRMRLRYGAAKKRTIADIVAEQRRKTAADIIKKKR